MAQSNGYMTTRGEKIGRQLTAKAMGMIFVMSLLATLFIVSVVSIGALWIGVVPLVATGWLLAFPSHFSIGDPFRTPAAFIQKLKLRQRVSRRALNAANERAAAAEAALEKAKATLKGRDRLLAHVSHELRNPMQAVMGMADLLGDTQLSDGQRHMVRTIGKSAESLVTFVTDTLDYSKLDAGKVELEHRPFDLRDCVEQCLDLMAGKAAEKNLELAYLMDDRVPSALIGDEPRVRQVLVNLLANALKFTDSGEVVVSVKSGSARRGRQEIQFAVSDTGVGIPEDRLNAIFDEFAQAEPSTTSRYGGTGLGLSICRRLVELMGGSIDVSSCVGLGSIFRFTIRAAVDHRGKASPNDRKVDLDGRRLLVVHDNATIRDVITKNARSWGMHVCAVKSGADALERLQAGEEFDLAVADRHMPQTDGIRLASEMRAATELNEFPVVLLTTPLGKDRDSLSIETAVSSPQFAAYLAKPIKPARLYESMCKALRSTPRACTVSPLVPNDAQSPSRRVVDANHVPLNIVVADDNETLRRATVRYLEAKGYSPESAANGREVLEILERVDCDLLLTDVDMPVMDGLTTATKIRENRPLDRRPYIIALTGETSKIMLEKCLAAGMDDYLAKPWELSELVEAIDRAAHTLQQSSSADTRAVA